MPRKAKIAAGQRLNRGQMAALLACSPSTLDRYVSSGCPVLRLGRTSQGAEFDSDAVLRWVRARGSEGASPAATAQSDAKRRHMLASAELREYELARLRGEMILVSDVTRIVTEELAEVRARLLSLPDRLCHELVGLDQEAIALAIRAEVVAALAELSADKRP